jgi:uncharacterized protein YktA (UPF0223 family)
MTEPIDVHLSKLQVAQALEDYIMTKGILPAKARGKTLNVHYQFKADYSVVATFTEHTEPKE